MSDQTVQRVPGFDLDKMSERMDIEDDAIAPIDKTGDSPGTVLEGLRKALAEEVKPALFRLPIPARDGVEIEFNTDIDSVMLNAWRKRSKDNSFPDGINPLRYACIVIANQAEAVIFNGTPAHDESDQPLNFKNPNLLQMLGVPAGQSTTAVRKLFGYDGHVLSACRTVISEAGFGEDIEGEESPTTASS